MSNKKHSDWTSFWVRPVSVEDLRGQYDNLFEKIRCSTAEAEKLTAQITANEANLLLLEGELRQAQEHLSIRKTARNEILARLEKLLNQQEKITPQYNRLHTKLNDMIIVEDQCNEFIDETHVEIAAAKESAVNFAALLMLEQRRITTAYDMAANLAQQISNLTPSEPDRIKLTY